MGDFKLTLEPADKIVFPNKKLLESAVSVELKITNRASERVAFKVKCTSNEMFRILPPVGALKAGESATLTLIFSAKAVPESGKHYFAFYYVKAEDEKKAPRLAWSEHKGDPDGTKKVFIDFKKEGDGEKK